MYQIRNHQRLVSRSSHMGRDYEIYSSEEVEKVGRYLKKLLDPGCSVLNFIGYDGTLLRKLMPFMRGCRITDYELSDEAAEFVKFKTARPAFVIGEDIGKLKRGSFDVLTCIFSMEKMPSPADAIGKLEPLVGKGGKLIIFAKSKYSPYGIFYGANERFLGVKNVEDFYIRSGPFEPLSVPFLKKVLKERGFKVRVRNLFFFPPELEEYSALFDGYSKRRGKNLSPLKIFAGGIIRLAAAFSNLTKKYEIPLPSSVVCVIAEK